jgi:hypothetical protein
MRVNEVKLSYDDICHGDHIDLAKLMHAGIISLHLDLLILYHILT